MSGLGVRVDPGGAVRSQCRGLHPAQSPDSSSPLGLSFLIPQRKGLDSSWKRITFQSSLLDTEMTIFPTYTLDSTGRDQVPACKVHPPSVPAFCFLSPAIRLAFEDGLHTWSHIQSQEVFHGSGPDLRDPVCSFITDDEAGAGVSGLVGQAGRAGPGTAPHGTELPRRCSTYRREGGWDPGEQRQ